MEQFSFISRRFSLILFLLFFLVLFSGCAGTSQAPVSSRQQQSSTEPIKKSESVAAEKTSTKTTAKESLQKQDATQGFHIVDKGETLYSIAWRYGYDFRDVSDWNQISTPYTIYPGQVIRLKPSRIANKKQLQPGPVVAKETKSQSREVIKPKAKTVVKTKKTPTKKQPELKKTRTVSGKIAWRWPTKGKILKSNLPTSKKGLNISGSFGQDIRTAAAGNVVYSGSGLLGYGRLIIIKHNETYLSAYAHNSQLLVQEGDDVVEGQKIARMGKTSGGQVLLHFEIRKNGQSINPVGLLPKS